MVKKKAFAPNAWSFLVLSMVKSDAQKQISQSVFDYFDLQKSIFTSKYFSVSSSYWLKYVFSLDFVTEYCRSLLLEILTQGV